MADPAPAEEDIARVWKLMKEIDICMFASKDGEMIRARPMRAHPKRERNAVYFLTSVRGEKDEQILADDNVCLSFAKPGAGKFLVVTGRARLSDNRALILELWDADAAAFWEGPDDPGVRVIDVTPVDAQFWEGPHGVVATIAMIGAAATGAPPILGDQRKVDLH